jgi:hypothetical protein
MKTYLNVPFEHKDQAKALGARFDMSAKRWYCPDGIDLMLFKRWLGVPTKPSAKRPKRAEVRRKKKEAAWIAKRHPERLPSSPNVYTPCDKLESDQAAHMREILNG